MIKKTLLIIFILLLVSLGIFFTWRYIGYINDKDPNKTFLLPRLQLALIEINSISAEKTEITAKTLIKNPLPVSFTVDSLYYKIFINGTEIVKNRFKKPIVIKGQDSSLLALPITLFTNELKLVFKENEQKGVDTLQYRIEVSLFAHILKKTIKLVVEKDFPPISAPEIKTERIEIDSLNFSRAALILPLLIKNKNSFSFEAIDIQHEFSIEGDKWIKGVIPGLITIKGQKTTELKIPIILSFKEMKKSLFDLLKKGTNVNYKLKLTFKMASENNSIQNTNVVIENSGTVKALLKSVKEIKSGKK